MKAAIAMLYFLFTSINLYAQINWIPIKSIDTDETTKQKSKPPQLKPGNNLIENVKVFQRLLDNKIDKEKSPTKTNKNWYAIKNIENN